MMIANYLINQSQIQKLDYQDPNAPTQPVRHRVPNRVYQQTPPPPEWMDRRRRKRTGCTCGCVPGAIVLLLGLILAGYFLAPGRTNVLVLGIDYVDPSSAASRSDSVVLTTLIPLEPYVGMLSVPRDLWVPIPGFGENRINTAHFFAEAQSPGSGPEKSIETVEANFGVHMDYYARVRFEGLIWLVDSMDGVTIELDEPLAGYPAGSHRLHGRQALFFARNRRGTDDFFRMRQGQILMKAILRKMLTPTTWPRLPAILQSYNRAVTTNVPVWLWPRLGLAIIRVGPDGIDNRIVEREMVTPYLTDQGANVLLPSWELIRPVVAEMFLP